MTRGAFTNRAYDQATTRSRHAGLSSVAMKKIRADMYKKASEIFAELTA